MHDQRRAALVRGHTVNTPVDDPRSLLRRLLKQASPAEGPSQAAAPPDTPEAPQPGSDTTSPIRPVPPASAPPDPPLIPNAHAEAEPAAPRPAAVESRLQAESALEELRQKTARVAQEFAEGKLNRAQFVAMYAHYNEKRVIIERLLARDPDTSTWQIVAGSGNTGFLREHFEARPLSYAIYDQEPPRMGELISSQGEPLLPEELVQRITIAVGMAKRTQPEARPQRLMLEDGRSAVFVPGEHTATIVIFSLEPSGHQVTLAQDLHRDFERANRLALARGIRQPDQLVFPHRALFDRPG